MLRLDRQKITHLSDMLRNQALAALQRRVQGMDTFEMTENTLKLFARKKDVLQEMSRSRRRIAAGLLKPKSGTML